MTEDEAIKLIAEKTAEALRVLEPAIEARKFISDGLGSQSLYNGALSNDLYSMLIRTDNALHNLEDKVKFVIEREKLRNNILNSHKG